MLYDQRKYYYLTSKFDLSDFYRILRISLLPYTCCRLSKKIKIMHPSFITCYYSIQEIQIILELLFPLTILVIPVCICSLGNWIPNYCIIPHGFDEESMWNKHCENYYVECEILIFSKCQLMPLFPPMPFFNFLLRLPTQYYHSIIHSTF